MPVDTYKTISPIMLVSIGIAQFSLFIATGHAVSTQQRLVASLKHISRAHFYQILKVGF